MAIEILSLLAFISAIFAVFFKQTVNEKMFRVFKPLTTILIIIIGIIVYLKFPSNYSAIIIASLVFALIGDVFLLKDKYFRHGLFSFTIVHVGIISAIVSISGFNWNVILFILLFSIASINYFFLRKGLKKEKYVVGFYIIVIAFMNWQAIGLAISNQALVYIAIAIASILFSLSDAVLAFAKFKKSFLVAEIVILATYWSAIYLFVIAELLF